ncbi:MAG: ABC transporter ATP-binding protein [Proteobacteria bacterium]|jgi:putative ABC transport system ATP-binding protein|nr:ABC transporter ATP-binding protein [Pseudomonadota bacterium]MDA1299820.1 ABC transporter ATP-binding protein [Pseudomonadota bacterium]
MDHVIVTKGLCRTFEVGESEVHALDHVDLVVEQGDFVAVMGPSGSGKSTLMNILGCLDTPDAGEYRLLDQAVSAMEDEALSRLRNRYIGFVFQSFHLLPRLTAIENVLLPLRFAQGDVHDSEANGRSLLQRLGLSERMHHRPNQLSGGQRQRVAIARALVASPPLLLADEPTGNLDSKTSVEIMTLFGELNADGQTVVMVTHEDDIAACAKRVIRMRDGKVESDARH